MDNLHVIADVEPLMIRRHERDHTIFDEHIPSPAVRRVGMLNTQQLWYPCWLSCRDMDQHRQLLFEFCHTLPILSNFVCVESAAPHQLLLHGRLGPDPVNHPAGPIDAPQGWKGAHRCNDQVEAMILLDEGKYQPQNQAGFFFAR